MRHMRILLLAAATAALEAAGTHTVYPDRFYDTFSFAHPPVARIKPGDKVITTLLDSRGHDKNGKLIIYADNVPARSISRAPNPATLSSSALTGCG